MSSGPKILLTLNFNSLGYSIIVTTTIFIYFGRYCQCPPMCTRIRKPISTKFVSIRFAVAADTPHSSRTSAFMIYACVCKNCSIFCQRKAFLSVFPSLIPSLVWMASMSDALKSNFFQILPLGTFSNDVQSGIMVPST